MGWGEKGLCIVPLPALSFSVVANAHFEDAIYIFQIVLSVIDPPIVNISL